MSSRIDRPHVLANFKPSQSEKVRSKRAKKSAAELRPGMSSSHLDCIRQLPCCACMVIKRSEKRNEAHHLKFGTGERGMGMRSTDKNAVPLCRIHHNQVENAGAKNEVAVFQSWGIGDALQLASDLWRSTGDVRKMTLIIYAHKTIG